MIAEKIASSPKIVSSSSTERIEMGSAASLIAAAAVPLDSGVEEALNGVVDSESRQIEHSVVEAEHKTLRAAEAAADLAKTRAASARAERENAARELTEAPHGGSRVKVAIWAFCGLACFAAEFVLTWTALCFVLDIPRQTVLGVLLGLAPPSGLAVLEVFFARLFEEPWQKMRSALPSGRRMLVNGAMVALLVALAAANGITIVHLAKAREEAIKLQTILSAADDASPAQEQSVDRTAIDTAILWISVVVCLDGSLFLLLSLAQGEKIRSRVHALRAATAAKTRAEQFDTELVNAVCALETVREEWKTAREKASLAAERYRRHCLHLIAGKRAAESGLPLEEVVDRAIRRKIAA